MSDLGPFPDLQRVRRNLWRPGQAIANGPPIPEAETFSRFEYSASAALAITLGTLQLAGGALIVPGVAVRGIAFYSGTTAYTVGNTTSFQWFALIDALTLEVLAKTADDGSTAWAATSRKALSFATPYQPKEIRPVYLGIVVAGSGAAPAPIAPSLRGSSGHNAPPDIEVPILGATSTAGLTDPASLGATAGALTTNTALPYAHWF